MGFFIGLGVIGFLLVADQLWVNYSNKRHFNCAKENKR